MTAHPPGGHDPQSDSAGPQDRRRFLGRVGLVAGAAWVTPVVLSATAGPAMASGTACPSSLTLTGSAQLLPNGTFPLTNAGCPSGGANYTVNGSCLTSNSVTYVWKEAGPVTLAAPLPVNRNGCAGTNFSLGTGTYSIPTGTTVCSLFVRAGQEHRSG